MTLTDCTTTMTVSLSLSTEEEKLSVENEAEHCNVILSASDVVSYIAQREPNTANTEKYEVLEFSIYNFY